MGGGALGVSVGSESAEPSKTGGSAAVGGSAVEGGEAGAPFFRGDKSFMCQWAAGCDKFDPTGFQFRPSELEWRRRRHLWWKVKGGPPGRQQSCASAQLRRHKVLFATSIKID